jgi:hypothetical protein
MRTNAHHFNPNAHKMRTAHIEKILCAQEPQNPHNVRIFRTCGHTGQVIKADHIL